MAEAAEPIEPRYLLLVLTSPHGAQGGRLSAVILGNIRHGNCIGVDLHSEPSLEPTPSSRRS